MRIKRQQDAIDRGELVPVYTVPGRTVRGSTYYQSIELLVTPEFAKFLIEQGDVTEKKQ